jgi:hypothetical protein
MSRQNDELERIRRIRDQQLAARDPRARDHALQQQVRARRQSKKLTVRNILADLTAKWTWMVVGGAIGAVLAIVVNLVFKVTWAEYVGYGLILFGMVVGRILGAIRDWGDEDWDKRT